MASTDAKSGFRLPWSGDRNESEDQSAVSGDEPTAMDPAQQSESESETPTMIDTPATTSGEAAQAEPAATEPVTTPEAASAPTPAPERKANKFMADLTKAMQAAAESARADSLERFATDAKAHVEGIHATSADEATELRKRADDDIASVREWSKAEIARIREETDERVTDRKERLEREIEAHAAEIEARIERVQSRVASFETEMAAFFERLLSEDDPTRFASMAETLPEPPPFDADDAWASITGPEIAQADEAPVAEAETAAEPVVAETVETTEPAETVETPVAEDSPVEASAETGSVEASADSGDLFGITADAGAGSETPSDADPRLTAIGIEPDFAAAEAEAAAYPAEASGADDEIPTIAEDALAARLAGLVADDQAPTDSATTRVVVTGLVSVASIAGFKRNLSRVAGVRSVGVSSGPDGEFVFAVTHDNGLGPRRRRSRRCPASVPASPTRLRGELTVAARDPESEEQRPMARPAIAVALPGNEAAPVAAELRAAGFTVASISRPEQLEALLASRRDVAVAILDGETDLDQSLEYYSLLRDAGRAIPALMVMSERAMTRLEAASGVVEDEYFTRPYSAESLRWRVEAMCIRSQTVDDGRAPSSRVDRSRPTAGRAARRSSRSSTRRAASARRPSPRTSPRSSRRGAATRSCSSTPTPSPAMSRRRSASTACERSPTAGATRPRAARARASTTSRRPIRRGCASPR